MKMAEELPKNSVRLPKEHRLKAVQKQNEKPTTAAPWQQSHTNNDKQQQEGKVFSQCSGFSLACSVSRWSNFIGRKKRQAPSDEDGMEKVNKRKWVFLFL